MHKSKHCVCRKWNVLCDCSVRIFDSPKHYFYFASSVLAECGDINLSSNPSFGPAPIPTLVDQHIVSNNRHLHFNQPIAHQMYHVQHLQVDGQPSQHPSFKTQPSIPPNMYQFSNCRSPCDNPRTPTTCSHRRGQNRRDSHSSSKCGRARHSPYHRSRSHEQPPPFTSRSPSNDLSPPADPSYHPQLSTFHEQCTLNASGDVNLMQCDGVEDILPDDDSDSLLGSSRASSNVSEQARISDSGYGSRRDSPPDPDGKCFALHY